jgi:hypothetical protein
MAAIEAEMVSVCHFSYNTECLSRLLQHRVFVNPATTQSVCQSCYNTKFSSLFLHHTRYGKRLLSMHSTLSYTHTKTHTHTHTHETHR